MADVRYNQHTALTGNLADDDRIPMDKKTGSSTYATRHFTPVQMRNYVVSSLATVAETGDYDDLSNLPTLGTASPLNVPASGDAATGEVVLGDDSRLTDDRNPTSHTHAQSEVTNLVTDLAAIQTAIDGKQAAGIYITALTGDGAASGPGSSVFTLATVNSNVGSFGGAAKTLVATVNAKGIVTAISETNIAIAANQVTSGQLALARGGTGADLSATGGGGQYVKQASLGGAFTVGAIAAGDLPSAIDAAKIADGSVTNAEFQRLAGVTSAIQTQLDLKASIAYADSLVVGLLDDRGNYDASGNVFPSTGGSGTAGAVMKGDIWTISVAGTLGGTAVTAGDMIRALVDAPGQTASNWAVSETNIGYTALNAALNDGQIYIGNSSNVGTARTLSGDVTVSNTGVTAIGAGKVTNAMLAGSIDLTAKVTGVLPVANGGTGINSLGAGVATFLGTPSSANLAAAVTGETGTGALVFGTSPDFTTSATIGGVAIPTISSSNTFTNKTLTASSNVLGGVTMTLGSDADGDIYYRASNVLTRLPKGTALQVLRMNAGATAPEWAANAASMTVGSSTITSGAATRLLYETSGNVLGEVSGATSNGTNVTFGSGNLLATSPAFTTDVTVTRNSIGVTSADGLALLNTTAAAVGAQQYGPRIRFKASGWKTTATAGAQDLEMSLELQAVQGTNNPTPALVIARQMNGTGGFIPVVTFDSQNTTESIDGYGRMYLGRNANSGAYNGLVASSSGLDVVFNGTSVFGSAQNQRFDMHLKAYAKANLHVGPTSLAVGTSGTNVLVVGNGTAPTTSPADEFQIYSGDSAAGDANAFARNELGEINRLTGLACRVSTQFDKTSSTTLADITGLSRNVEASRSYSFTAILYTTSNSAGGVKVAIGGTATATSIIYEVEVKDGSTISTVGTARATALATTVGDVTAVTVARIIITGTIVVNAAGTLTVQFAQNVSNGTASSVLVNSVFFLRPIG